MTRCDRVIGDRSAPNQSAVRKTFAWKTGRAFCGCLVAVLVLLGCGSEPSGAGAASGASAGGATSMGGGGGAPAAPSVNPLGRARCQAPDMASASPADVERSVALINALPKPTSVACFVESLVRPLNIYATSSTLSAQPADSQRSPRVFIKLDKLWLSVVVDGDSSPLIEFGLLVDDQLTRSLKGELKLPIDAPIAPSTPFDRVRYDDGTLCGLCHANEQQETKFGMAFSSDALRPRPEGRVSVDALRLEARACDWHVEPHRCEMLSAIFDGGGVNEVQFPETMRTFF